VYWKFREKIMENNTENNVTGIIEENNTENNMNNTENVGIEDNFEQLEDIISKMQSDRITLEQSFELYNKGLSLVQDCNNQIDKIEKQIKIIEEGNINE
jgi:exodeoxyribonuclease VII small subunit